jgi:protein associated with RNAse G/E
MLANKIKAQHVTSISLLIVSDYTFYTKERGFSPFFAQFASQNKMGYTILWLSLEGLCLLIVLKLNPLGEEKIRYPARISARLDNGVVLEAYWNHASRDLGYTTFEPGDRFIEYFYDDRWFNIFAIATANGRRKGWYCNIAAPARIDAERVEQVDLLLDVWVTPDGQPLILDEDEFAADDTLTEEQRQGALQGLQDLLALIAARREPFVEESEDPSDLTIQTR